MPVYRVTCWGRENVERCRRLVEDGETNPPFSYEVKGVTTIPEWCGKVYNCEVGNDPSYVVAPGIVAHNCCGFSIWKEVANGLPCFVVGDTPGLSKPAETLDELVWRYQTSAIFINTSTVSPIPTALLEAMSCGCAVVSTDNCMIPDVIQDGVNGYRTNDKGRMRAILERLLESPDECERVGRAARETILGRFNVDHFLHRWGSWFQVASSSIPHVRDEHDKPVLATDGTPPSGVEIW